MYKFLEKKGRFVMEENEKNYDVEASAGQDIPEEAIESEEVEE